MDLATATTRVAVLRLLKASLQLAKNISILTAKLEKKEDREKIDENFTTFFEAIDEALKSLEEGRQK